MRKLLLSFFLLALIAGVSYLKLRQQDSRSEQERITARSEVASELAQKNYLIDSLGDAAMTPTQARTLDSLEAVIDNQNQKIASLSNSAPIESSTSPTIVSTKSLASKGQEILSFYKKKYQELPSDLSTYEKRVAVGEVKEETARQYSITVAQLDNLREQYKLTY